MLSRSNGITKEDYYDENHLFVCSCGDLSDNLVITVWQWEKTFEIFEKNPTEVNLSRAIEDTIEVSLFPSTAHYLGFFGRLWAALKYVFLKKKCSYDVMEFRTPDLQRIRKILVDFRTHVVTLAGILGKANELPAPSFALSDKDKVVLKCRNGNELVFYLDEPSFEDFGIDVLQMLVCLPEVGFFKRLKFGWRYLKTYQDENVNLSYEDAGKLHSFLTKMR